MSQGGDKCRGAGNGGKAGHGHRGARFASLDNAWELPVYIANFVLMDYGTGAIFGCPAHDARDFEFATKYGLAIPPVFVPEGADEAPLAEPFVPMKSEKVRYIRGFAGPDLQTGGRCRCRRHRALRICWRGRGVTNYRLRDWGISRQRYWGCPIPVVHCAACGVVPEKKENLPIELPDDVHLSIIPGNPLDRHPTWRDTPCPACGAPGAARDGHDGHLYGFVVVLRPFHRAPCQDPHGRRRGRLLDERRSIYRRD